jgi:hypothetical protein
MRTAKYVIHLVYTIGTRPTDEAIKVSSFLLATLILVSRGVTMEEPHNIIDVDA